MGIKVVKFGGSSLADAKMFRRVKEIILSDPTRAYVVPSAPGKRSAEDEKITDLLYKCYACVERKEPYEPIFEIIAQRYLDTVRFRHDELVEPSRWHADLVLNGTLDRGQGVEILAGYIRSKL